MGGALLGWAVAVVGCPADGCRGPASSRRFAPPCLLCCSGGAGAARGSLTKPAPHARSRGGRWVHSATCFYRRLCRLPPALQRETLLPAGDPVSPGGSVHAIGTDFSV